jgi:tetratricopeptide (TPR) repeat protein
MKMTMPLRNAHNFSPDETVSVILILREYWQESIDLEQIGDFTKALELHEQILAEVGCSYEAYLRAGWLHYQAGGYPQAIQFFDIASENFPEAVAPRFGAMGCYVAMADSYHAARMVKAIIELDGVKSYATPRDAVIDAAHEFHMVPDFLKQPIETPVRQERVGAA